MASVTDAPPPAIQRDEETLSSALDEAIPPRIYDRNLLIATWNVRAFGGLTRKWVADADDSPTRDLQSIRVIGEIIRRFDVVALQEVRGDLEALRETLHVDLDVERTADVLERFRRRELTVETVGERTPMGLGGRSSGTELLSPENADASVIETVKERIQNDRMLLVCLHCLDWRTKRQVKRISETPTCPRCESTRIAALNPWADEVVTALRKEDRDDEEERMVERAFTAGSLVQGHGKKAVIALAARGVGPRNAARVINKLREDEDEFYRDILAREREYARTNAFWD